MSTVRRSWLDRYYIKVAGQEGSRIPHKTLADAYVEAHHLFNLLEQRKRVYVLGVVGILEAETGDSSPRVGKGQPTDQRVE